MNKNKIVVWDPTAALMLAPKFAWAQRGSGTVKASATILA